MLASSCCQEPLYNLPFANVDHYICSHCGQMCDPTHIETKSCPSTDQ